MNRYLVLICLTILLLMGCKKSMEEEWDEFDATIQNVETKTPMKENANVNYQGEQVPLPDNIANNSETLLSVTSGANSPLELYSITRGTYETSYYKYILLDTGEWESQDCKLNEQIKTFLEADSSYESLSLNYIKRGKDGALYAMGNVTYYEEDVEEEEDEDERLQMFGNSKIFSLGLEGEELFELPLEPLEGDNNGRDPWIVDFDVLANGELFVQYNGVNTIVDSSTGETIMSYDSESTSGGIGLGDNVIFTVEIMNNKFNIIEATTGEPISTIDHIVHDRSNYPSWRAVGNEGGVFLADISGIYKAESFTATGFRQLISSADSNDFTSMYIVSFIVSENEDIYILFLNMANGTFIESDNPVADYKIMKYSPASE